MLPPLHVLIPAQVVGQLVWFCKRVSIWGRALWHRAAPTPCMQRGAAPVSHGIQPLLIVSWLGEKPVGGVAGRAGAAAQASQDHICAASLSGILGNPVGL